MTAREFTTIVLKVWGAILIVNALASLPSTVLFATLAPPADVQAEVIRATQVGQMLDLGWRVALGIGLILCAGRVVEWAIPAGSPLRIDVYASELSALCFALVGLYVLIQGVQNVVGAVYSVSTKPVFPGPDTTFWYVWQQQRETIVRAFVQIGSGLVLMLWRQAVTNAWWWLSGGEREVESSAPSSP